MDGRPSILFVRLIVLAILLAAWPLFPASADDAPESDLELLIRKIETRSNAWIAYRASLELTFTNDQNEEGQCRCKLTYDRLREKMVLECKNTRNGPLFTFKTADTRFELFLPAAQTVYRGDIFQLEGSDDLSSHLEPLALYRSLKLAAIAERDAEISEEKNESVTFHIRTQRNGRRYVSRALTANRRGEVFNEVYFNPAGIPRTTIQRSDFRKIEDSARLLPGPLYFPYQIHLTTRDETGGDENTTQMTFRTISLLSFAPDDTWDVSYPPETRFSDIGSTP
jgi:hypothetical protein